VRALGPPQVGRGGDKLHAQLEAWVARAKALLCQSIGFGSATRRGAWLLRATLAAARRDTRVVRLHDRDDTKVGTKGPGSHVLKVFGVLSLLVQNYQTVWFCGYQNRCHEFTTDGLSNP